jgi:hypothetical protein
VITFKKCCKKIKQIKGDKKKMRIDRDLMILKLKMNIQKCWINKKMTVEMKCNQEKQEHKNS